MQVSFKAPQGLGFDSDLKFGFSQESITITFFFFFL